jgi:hypothetical protein
MSPHTGKSGEMVIRKFAPKGDFVWKEGEGKMGSNEERKVGRKMGSNEERKTHTLSQRK